MPFSLPPPPGSPNVEHLVNSTNNSYLAAPILNTIKWSEALDEVFINNSNEDPGFKWQYFGSETGVFRSYPGIYYIFKYISFESVKLFNNLSNWILTTVLIEFNTSITPQMSTYPSINLTDRA